MAVLVSQAPWAKLPQCHVHLQVSLALAGQDCHQGHDEPTSVRASAQRAASELALTPEVQNFPSLLVLLEAGSEVATGWKTSRPLSLFPIASTRKRFTSGLEAMMFDDEEGSGTVTGARCFSSSARFLVSMIRGHQSRFSSAR